MPDFLARIVGEVLLRLLGHAIAWLLVPLLTLGRVRVEPTPADWNEGRTITARIAPFVGWAIVIAGFAIVAVIRFRLLGES